MAEQGPEGAYQTQDPMRDEGDDSANANEDVEMEHAPANVSTARPREDDQDMGGEQRCIRRKPTEKTKVRGTTKQYPHNFGILLATKSLKDGKDAWTRTGYSHGSDKWVGLQFKRTQGDGQKHVERRKAKSPHRKSRVQDVQYTPELQQEQGHRRMAKSPSESDITCQFLLRDVQRTK